MRWHAATRTRLFRPRAPSNSRPGTAHVALLSTRLLLCVSVTHVLGCLSCGHGRLPFHARARTCIDICPHMLLCAVPLPELARMCRHSCTPALANPVAASLPAHVSGHLLAPLPPPPPPARDVVLRGCNSCAWLRELTRVRRHSRGFPGLSGQLQPLTDSVWSTSFSAFYPARCLQS